MSDESRDVCADENELKPRAGLRRDFIGFSAAGAAVAIAIFAFDPSAVRLLPHCPLHALLGLLCPLCGGLRSMHALLNGRVLEAARLNPLAVALAAWLFREYVSLGLAALRGRGLRRLFTSRRWRWALVVLLIVFTVARNVPVYPFSILAP